MQISRREALILAGGLIAGVKPAFAAVRGQRRDFGWLNDPALHREWIKGQSRPYYADFAGEITGSGKGKQVLLWPYLEKVMGKKYYPSIQDIGDCTSHATAMGVNILTAVQILMHGRPERWVAMAATEPIHAGARVEIGGSKIPSRRDGACVSWACDWVQQYGVLLRQKYGAIDLTEYNAQLARQWGSRGVGVPSQLEAIAKEHPVKMAKLTTCWSEARDLVANGYPVVIGSDVGFNSQSDGDGFLSPGPTWWHALLLAGIDDKSKRPGGLILNWWPPSWTSGPKHKLGTPASAFWADADVIDQMLGKEDSFALSNYVGYKRQPLNYMLIPR
jgi:hypothetical protein